MLNLPKIDYCRPENEEELLVCMEAHQDNFALLAGGTALINDLKRGLSGVRVLISLGALQDLKGVEYGRDHDRLLIGSMTTLAEMAASPVLQDLLPGLVQAVRMVAAPPIRNRATLGGNLCLDTRCYYYNQSLAWRKLREPCYKCGGQVCLAVPGAQQCQAVFSADLPPLLLALGAKLLVGPEETREMFLTELYTGNGVNPHRLPAGEYIKSIVIEDVSRKWGYYRKFRLRKSLDFPLAGIAMAGEITEDKSFKQLKVVLGALASGPLFAEEAANILSGRPYDDDDAVELASAAVVAAAKPVANIGSRPGHRKKMAGILLKRMVIDIRDENKNPD